MRLVSARMGAPHTSTHAPSVGGQAFVIKLRPTKERSPSSMLVEPPSNLNHSYYDGQTPMRWRHIKYVVSQNRFFVSDLTGSTDTHVVSVLWYSSLSKLTIRILGKRREPRYLSSKSITPPPISHMTPARTYSSVRMDTVWAFRQA